MSAAAFARQQCYRDLLTAFILVVCILGPIAESALLLRRIPRATVHLLFEIAAPLFLRTKDRQISLADAPDRLLCTQTYPA